MRLHLTLLLACVTGCQCVTVPDRQYACEPDDLECLAADAGDETDSGTPDSGAPDAGSPDSGTPDAGAEDAGTEDAGTEDAGAEDAGTEDAGTEDAGTVDAGPTCDGGVCRFDDGGFCTDWPCVYHLWEPSVPSGSTGSRVTDLPPGIDGGQYGWFGGVLLPDGRVLAIMHTADQFLIFDPRTEAVTPVGPIYPSTARKFAGGVLAPNGRVYIFPYEATTLLEFNPEDGGFEAVGPPLTSADGGAPLFVGGVVDAYGNVWSASENTEGPPLIRFDPEKLVFTEHRPKGIGWGGWWGMARLPDDRLLVFPKEYFANPALLSPFILAVQPPPPGELDAGFELVDGFDLTNGGFPLQGGSLTREGSVCATPASLEQRVVCVGLAPLGLLRAEIFPGAVLGYGVNASFGDGRVWTTPDTNNLLARIASDGGVTTTTVQGGRYGYLGLVATPQGLVAIPGAPGTGFLLIQPGSQMSSGLYDSRPLPVLLSPFFNKL